MEYKYKIILFIFLLVVTIACHAYVDRYKKVSPDMLSDDWQVRAPLGSNGGIKENGLFLFSSNPKKSVDIQQELPFYEGGSLLKLSADIKCDNVHSGEKAWNRARLLLVQNDGQKDRWDFPHEVAAIDGFKNWDTYGKVFSVQSETKRIQVVAQMSRCSGTFELKNIHLYPVIQTQVYGWAQKSILLLWGLFGVFLVVSCSFNGDTTAVLRFLLTASVIIIVIGTTMPGKIKTQVSQEISGQIEKNSTVLAQVLPVDLSKAGHFVFFALFGMILTWILQQTSFFVVLAHILMVAGGTEMAQFFIDGRTPLFTDFFIDAAGGISGLAMVYLASFIFHEKL